MIKYIKTLAFVIIAVMLASPSSAKVMKVDDADNNKVGGSGLLSGKVKTCAQAGMLTQRPKGNICGVKKLATGAVCYTDCKCSPEKFPISDLVIKGLNGKIVAAGERCVSESDKSVWHSAYSCGDDLITAKRAKDYEKYFNIDTIGAKISAKYGETSDGTVGKELACYDPSKFTCKAEFKEFTSTNASAVKMSGLVIGGKQSSSVLTSVQSGDEPIEYKVAKSPSGKMCVVGVEKILKGAFEVTPTDNRCGVVTTKTAKFFDKKYSFFSGCKTSGDCGAVTADCVLEAKELVTVYDEGTNKTSTKECKYDKNYLCDL